MRIGLVVIGLLMAFKIFDAQAYYCSRPEPPFCLDMLGMSRDQFSFDMCRSEMETYMSEVDDFLSCLKREADEVSDEQDEAIDRFNCYARGETICF